MRHTLLIAISAIALLLSACGGETSVSLPPADAPPATDPATTPSSETFSLDDWESVVAAARGSQVNWYMWGGNESINTYVDTFYGQALAERYDITLNRVPVSDAIDFVNQVLSEKEAGIDPGSIDLMWINGENFASLKQADMLYTGWNRAMPNSALVDWDNPVLNLDFGVPIETLESPWSSAQFQFLYDTARLSEEDLPRSYAELQTWACEHPGRFTYIAPGPGAFQGTRFVKGALYEISGGAEQWATFDQALWDEWSPQVWTFLNDLEACLWRAGETYPKDENELHSLFANQEIDFSITQAIAGPGPLIDQGLVPATTRAFVFDNYMIGDFNYVAIPANAPHKAAALVLANLLLEPEFQAAQLIPENGFGLGFGIDITKVSNPDDLALLENALAELGPSATAAEDLASSMTADAAAPYQALVEAGWRENVLIRE